MNTEIQHLRELMQEKEKALVIQAKEYERRLEILNHEAERLRLMQASYIPREVYESEKKRD